MPHTPCIRFSFRVTVTSGVGVIMGSETDLSGFSVSCGNPGTGKLMQHVETKQCVFSSEFFFSLCCYNQLDAKS